nr:hypothetical protein [Tanacetum cinerariifolium]
MNYEPIVVGTQSNGFADSKSFHDDGSKPSCDDGKKVDEDPRKKMNVKIKRRKIMLTELTMLIIRGVCQPPGFEDLNFLDIVYKVEKALYELHQAPRAWYLKGQPKLGLWYPKDSPFDLVAYTDSDYAGSSLDRKSTTGDEAVHKELDDRLVRAATTASSLEAEHDNGNIDKTQSKATPNESSSPETTSGGGPRFQDTIRDIIAQTRFENVSKLSNDSLLTKGEDASKRGKIEAIDADEDITLVNDQDDAEMFDINDLHSEEVFVKKEVIDEEVNTVGEVNAASIAITVSAAATITTEEITLVQALMEIKITKPKVKGIVLQEPSESPTTTTTIPKKKSQDKGKEIMVEEPVKLKKKDQIRLDEETALKLQDELIRKNKDLQEKNLKKN